MGRGVTSTRQTENAGHDVGKLFNLEYRTRRRSSDFPLSLSQI